MLDVQEELAGILEGSEEDSDDDSTGGGPEGEGESEERLPASAAPSHGAALAVDPTDFIHAFSHFTYRHTNRKIMVCDLQGELDDAASPPVFHLTDPVIHRKTTNRRKKNYGRTDRGEKGMHAFFKTHKCTKVCEALGLPSAEKGVPSERSRSTK